MSKIEFSEETVRKVAHLARLELTDSETKMFTAQVGQVLGYIEKLNQLDTSKVQPMMGVQEFATPLREDVVIPGPGTEAMLACAPEQVFDNFKVPQVMAAKGKTAGGEE